jgi:hypothetical protein
MVESLPIDDALTFSGNARTHRKTTQKDRKREPKQQQ